MGPRSNSGLARGSSLLIVVSHRWREEVTFGNSERGYQNRTIHCRIGRHRRPPLQRTQGRGTPVLLMHARSKAWATRRARYYNVQTGRFETMDQVPGDIFDPATLNLYFYTADNPVNLTDPSGNDIASYAALKKAFRGTAYQIHHLIEKRFVPIFLVAGCTIATNLLPDEHQYYTNAWRQAIGYTNGNNPTNTANALPQQVWDAALAIYAGNAALLAAIEECRQQLGQ